jgi:hypothetical protein
MPIRNEPYYLSYMTLRQAIGWVGLLMPIVVKLGAYLFQGIATTGSISAYYYTGMRDVFVLTLVLVGALLACYRTPDRQDTWVGGVAGLSAIGIALFPMDPEFAAQVIARFPETEHGRCYVIRGILGYHMLFVGIFFAAAFYLVTFRFSALTAAVPTRQKLVRNQVYRVCGAAMLLAFVAIGLLAWRNDGESIFWPESVAVIAFATAWLVKGQIVLKDTAG